MRRPRLAALPLLLVLSGLLAGAAVRAAPAPLYVPPRAGIPAAEPPPAGSLPPELPKVPAPAKARQRRVQVTVVPLSHPGVPETAGVAALRLVSDALRRNERLEMKDLDVRLSDFAQEVPADQVDLARTTYQKGRELLQALELDRAIQQLSDAVDQLVVVLPYIRKQELADAMMSLALAHFQKGSRQKCNAALLRLLTWRPDYQPDPELFPEQVRGPLEEARRAIARLARGALHVSTEPDGAQVFVDGGYAGVTPVDVADLAAGEHYLTFKKIGFKKALRVAQISPRNRAVAHARLLRSEKYLLVKQAIERVERDLGGRKLDPVMDNLKETLYLDQAVFLRLQPGPAGDPGPRGPARVTLYLYDLRTRLLLQQISALVGPAEQEAKLPPLAEGLYTGVDFEATPRPEPEAAPAPVAKGRPLYKKWWFWTAAGAILAGSAAAIAAGVIATRSGGCPDGHACVGPVIY